MSKKISELPAATTLTDNDELVVNHIDTSGTDPETITSRMTAANLKSQLGINEKADKVSGGTSGNFAGIDSNGNLMDSGNKASDFLTLHQTIKQDGVTGATANRFGTCSTGASTAEKTVSITSGTLSLEAGVRITVLFENINTASTPTLNVNNTGAKSIYIGANQITGNYKGLIKGVIDFVYDGTYWQYIGSATLVKGSMEQLYSDGPVSLTAAAVGAIPALNRETSYNDTSDHVYSTGYVNDIVEDTISDAWVSGHSYSVGDYCIDENILYKCKTAHTSAAAYEPPYASYWDAVKVGDELKSLNSGLAYHQLSNSDDLDNIWDIGYYIFGGTTGYFPSNTPPTINHTVYQVMQVTKYGDWTNDVANAAKMQIIHAGGTNPSIWMRMKYGTSITQWFLVGGYESKTLLHTTTITISDPQSASSNTNRYQSVTDENLTINYSNYQKIKLEITALSNQSRTVFASSVIDLDDPTVSEGYVSFVLPAGNGNNPFTIIITGRINMTPSTSKMTTSVIRVQYNNHLFDGAVYSLRVFGIMTHS